MANNSIVSKVRKILHVKPSTTAGSLFAKEHKEKKCVKAKLRKLGHRLRLRGLPTSKSLTQVGIIDPEPAGRVAVDLCQEAITSRNISPSTEQSYKRQSSPGSNVDPLGEVLAQALTVYQRLSVPAENHNSNILKFCANEERRLTAVDSTINPIPQLLRNQGPTELAVTNHIPRNMVRFRATASSEQESRELQDMVEFGITPPGSPPESEDRNISTPRRHMVDESGADVLDGHPYFSTSRQATLVDNVLSRNSQIPTFGHSDAANYEAAHASIFFNATEAAKESTPKTNASDVFWNPKEEDVLAGKSVGKPSSGLWAKFAAAKYGVETSPDRDFAPEYELLSADKFQAARTELHDCLDQDDPSRLFSRRLESGYKTPNNKKLKSPNQIRFQDSGYVSPPKPDEEGPIDLRSPDASKEPIPPETTSKSDPTATVKILSLALIPSNISSSNLQPLSPNEIDNLTIEFANRAIKYLDLGLDYMAEQSNLELQAQRQDRKSVFNDQIPVGISDILSRVALMRPHFQGTPAVSRTRDFEAPAAAIKVDDHTFLNLPEAEKGCVLRIGVGKDGRVAYYLNLMVPARGVDDGMEELTIVSQIDVTSVVKRLALQEHNARPKAAKSTKALVIESDEWFEQALHSEGVWKKRALIDSDKDCSEKSLGPPSRQTRRLLAFFLKLGSEHQECAVFAGKKPLGWEDIHWQTSWVTRDVHENEDDENPMYEKSVDERMWSQIQYKMDDDWESFVWRDTISWGKESEQRRAYFIPMADRWSVGEEEREKWWLMFLSDLDEDAWRMERFV
ncbi:hypothetical protein E2P81_ATG00639 [Venturia nashicola]|uniref:Uncharacterized protein n=1 Tax=Venturia nashicola TaxID=86259 RepID=A0A4Z1PEF3_9PEZI|nr:hypothetical protein E6O75_ATG00652 [Venturia nashicola]TLD39652.1 hypothetical protein E2P81_ATG00639 [Venturia nashicola]